MITITPVVMTGVFGRAAEEFIAYKRDQGYKYYSEEKVLGRFCRFAEERGIRDAVITKELAMDWIAPREGEATKSRMHRISMLNQFSQYLELMGNEVCALPRQNTWMSSSFTPYIFSHEEISRFFSAADRICPRAQARNMEKALPVLFRLLYSCGLRVSEAVNLHCRDVDLEKGVLTVREAKNGQDRLIPLSESMRLLCIDYCENVIYWLREDDYFFPAPDRTILSPNTVYQRFRGLLWDAGIHYKGKGAGPRLHDLRHTFAVHTLQRWIENGEDLMAMLPVLSVFMGHKSMKATSRYLRLTAEVYPDVVRQIEDTCAYVIPGGDNG